MGGGSGETATMELLRRAVVTAGLTEGTVALRSALEVAAERTRATSVHLDDPGQARDGLGWSEPGGPCTDPSDRLTVSLPRNGGRLVLLRRRGRFSDDDRTYVAQVADAIGLLVDQLPDPTELAPVDPWRPIDTGGLVGSSTPMRRVLDQVAVCADLPVRVLLTGEPGTGKSMVARVLHANSARPGRFVAVNCARLTPERAMVDLFGAKEGAYTGQVGACEGLLSAASGGTLFLDEVCELPREVQAQLLIFLQDGTWRRVGDLEVRQADVRVIAATNADLSPEHRGAWLREDLLDRLSEFRIHLPRLADRASDIPALAQSLAARVARGMGLEPIPVGADLVAWMQTRPWPGNVREVENTLRRAIVWARARNARVLRVQDVCRGDEPSLTSLPMREAADRFKREYAARVLEECEGRRAEAARRLGVHRSYLYQLLQPVPLSRAVGVSTA